MEFRQLEIFRALAHELNFTRAAERVRTVQSNVTTQIKALEQELGTSLFDRLGKQVKLTESGQRFLSYVERILTLTETARQEAAGTEKPAGTLTLSAVDSVVTYRLPGFLHAFRKSYPEIDLTFHPLTAGMPLRSQLQSGMVDAAFVIDNVLDDQQLRVEALTHEPMAFIASPDHPLAKRRNFSPADLKLHTLLLTEPRCSYRMKFEQVLARARITPASVMGFGSIEALKECAVLGMGVGFLPQMVVQSDVRSGRLVALRWSRPEFTMVTQLVWHKDKWLSPAFRIFVEEARRSFNAINVPRKAG